MAEPMQQSGISLFAEERFRQKVQEGFSAEHDDRHGHGELAMAAQAYIDTARKATAAAKENPAGDFWKSSPPAAWPWHWEDWKPSSDPLRNLVKAGALLAAEVDRLLRERKTKSNRKVTVMLNPQEFALLRRAIALAIDGQQIECRTGTERIRELDRLQRATQQEQALGTRD